MVKKKNLEREREQQVAYTSHFIILFRNRPMRITNIIINTVNIGYFSAPHSITNPFNSQ